MALDKEFFDSVNIDVVKKKYYNANKVNALLSNIQQQAETMGQENELLRTQLEALNGQKSEIGDTLLSARALAKKIEDQARAQAEETIRQAQEKADAIVREAEHKRRELAQSLPDQQEYAAKCVENCLNKLKKQHIEAIEMLNNEWQDFLCGLMPEEHTAEPELSRRQVMPSPFASITVKRSKFDARSKVSLYGTVNALPRSILSEVAEPPSLLPLNAITSYQ